MNSFTHKRLLLILGFVGAFIFPVQAFGQTSRVDPCNESGTPDRPTLTKQTNIQSSEAKEARPCAAENSTVPGKVSTDLLIKFEGLANLGERELRREISERRIAMPADTIHPLEIANASKAIQEILVARGYTHAEVSARVEQVDPPSHSLIFVIKEGPRIKVADYRFEGNRVFSTTELTEAFSQCTSQYGQGYYNPEVFEYCRRRVDNHMRSRGYLQSRLEDPKIEETANGLVITSTVSEGVLFRVARIEFEGARLFSSDELRSMFPLTIGDIANGELISKWLYETLKGRYGELGYIQYSPDVTPEYLVDERTGEGRVSFHIMIDEGNQFKIRNISFDGTDLRREQLLPLLLIHDGQVYSQKLFEKSINALNDTGLFETIDKDKDVDFRSDEEEGLIDLVIKLRTKSD